jgi:hypothetical protein
MVHKGLPLTSTRLMFRLGITSETNKLDSFVMLKIKNLRNWKKWSENKKAKEYLETLDDTVRLDEIVESYRLLVVEFYKWFDKRQEEIHKKEFEEVKRLQSKMKLLLK